MHKLVLTIPAVMLAGCGIAESSPSPSGTRLFDLAGFDQVELAGADDVRVVAGPAFSVTASGAEKSLEQLKIEVRGSTLKVGRKSRGWSLGWSDDRGVVVTVTMPVIKAASLAGSGDFSIDEVDTPAFTASIAGSGNMAIKSAKVEKFSIDVAGSGDVSVAGSGKMIDISVAGSGNVTADKMAAEQAKIAIAGSGDVAARASLSASVDIAGSGDVNISGTTNCTTSKIGSGDVRCGP